MGKQTSRASLAAVTSFMWYPVLLFEVALALWLIVKGVVAPAHAAATRLT